MARRQKKELYNDNSLAIAYYRYSSSGQDTSVEQQREAAQKYADSHGLKIIKEYQDEAISGTSANRPGFQRMLAEISDIRPGALILWKTDRLSRDVYDVAIAKKVIRTAGCRIHYVAEKTPDGSPEDSLMEGFLEQMAAYYSKQLSVNVRRGQKYNSDRGLYLGKKLLGYTTEGEGRHNKRYVIDPVTGPLVQRIFRMYADEGLSMSKIADKLNAEGRRTVRNRRFTTNSLRQILKNDSYIGVYRFSDKVIENGMPVLIDRDLFDRVQEQLKHNKKFGAQNARGLTEEGKPRFWLTGKLYCGHCGESMQGTSGRSHTGDKYYYYSCNDQHKGKRGNGCKKKSVRKEWIEGQILRALQEYLSDDGNLASLAVDVSEYYKKEYDDHGYLDGLKVEWKSTEKALDNVISAVIRGASGERINAELDKLESRKKGLQEAIDTEEAKKRMVHDEVSIAEYFNQFKNCDLSDPEDRDLIFNYFIDKIYLYDDYFEVIGWHSMLKEGESSGTRMFAFKTVTGSTASCSGARKEAGERSKRRSPFFYCQTCK